MNGRSRAARSAAGRVGVHPSSSVLAVLLLLGVAMGVLALSGPAGAEVFAARADAPAVRITAYESGRVLVHEVREVQSPVGRGRLVLPGLPAGLDAGSLQVRSLSDPSGFRVLEADLLPGLAGSLADRGALLNGYVGRKIRVVLPGRDGPSSPRQAELLAPGDPAVLRLDGELYVGPVEAYLLPEDDDTAPGATGSAEPGLALLVDNKGAASQRLELSYLAQGVSWKAEYVLSLAPSGDKAVLAVWALVRNGLDVGFSGAGLSLVSGQVNEQPEAVFAMESRTMDKGVVMAAPSAGVSESRVFDYHVFELDRPVDLPAGRTKQLALLESRSVGVVRSLVSRWDNFWMDRTPEPVQQDVAVRLTLANTEAGGLGRALPAGTARIYQQRAGASDLLVGEDAVERSAVGQDIVLNPGGSFDVTVERSLEKYERQGDKGAVMTWRITARNGGDRVEDLVLEEALPGQWRLISADAPHETRGGSVLAFPVRLEAKGGQDAVTVSYTVSVTY